MNINSFSSVNYLQLALRASSNKTSASSAGQTQVSLDVTASVTTVTGEEAPRTIEDVKREFYEFLDSLRLSPGLSRTPISVNITEKAFEKMLNNPDYEQKMKDLCVRDLCDPEWGRIIEPSALRITIDADAPEEYLGSSYNHPQDADKADGDSFWNRRASKDKKAADKRAQEKRDAIKALQERAAERKRLGDGLFKSNYSITASSGLASLLSSFASTAGSTTGSTLSVEG